MDHDAAIDGELVALDASGRASFSLMQNPDRAVSLLYCAFDLLFLDGADLRGEPLVLRKEKLKAVLPDDASIRYSDHIEENGVRFFKEAEKQKLEGVMGKRASSAYQSGRRSPDWLKIKTVRRQEAVVIGYTKPRNTRKYVGSLVLAVREGDEWKYVGHTGGSMGGKSLKEVYDMLTPLEISAQPAEVPREVERNAVWVRPKIVVEIKFTEWTGEGHMRHPIIAGFREDKEPEDVVIEKETSMKKAKVAAKKDLKTATFTLTNLDKKYWPQEGYTKGDMLAYYEKIGDTILPYMKERPLVLFRHPNGIDKAGFFQKDSSDLNLPDFVHTTMVHSESNDKEIRYVVCDNKETLLYAANLGCIEMNVWNSRVDSLDKPDFYVIDLDPGDNTFEEVIEVAQVTHEVLTLSCEESYPKTSGKTGIHVYVPLRAKYDYDQVRNFAELVVRVVHSRIPGITSLERSPAKRKDKIYLDWLQNRTGQTLAAPYSLRPVAGACVSTPLEWKEVKKGLSPRDFTIENIFDRLKKKGDLWKPILGKGVDLKAAIVCLERELESAPVGVRPREVKAKRRK
ncbi:MAG: DNA ligase D, partial [Patescibacteria group bacterium]|nr:DNA ligase D [Patescibacteria group bacterium]